jgi:hypothetical protein
VASIRTVFLSSVAAGLEQYRDAVYEAINGLDDYKCVRMEDFGARDCQPEAFCRQKIAESDIFVGIVGQLYGSCPPSNEKSFSELEYEAAVESGRPGLMFLATEEFPVPAHLIEPDAKREKQRAFRSRVNAETLRETFDSEEDLVSLVVKAIHNQEKALPRTGPAPRDRVKSQTRLLFPFVTNLAGFDTGIAVSNISQDPFGTKPEAGPCTVYYYGRSHRDSRAVFQQASAVLGPGEQMTFTLSGGNAAFLLTGALGFQGYLIVVCNFPAHGFAHITDGFGGKPNLASGYLATVLPGGFNT